MQCVTSARKCPANAVASRSTRAACTRPRTFDADLERAVEHGGHDVDVVIVGPVVPHRIAGRTIRHAERAVGRAGVEAAEIVEADRGPARERRRVRRSAEIPQHAVPEPARRHASQERFGVPDARAQIAVDVIETHRIPAREPAHRAADIDVEGVVTAVTFHRHQHLSRIARVVERHGEARQEQVVGLRAIGAMRITQQRGGGVAVEPRDGGVWCAGDRRAVHWERGRCGRDVGPVVVFDPGRVGFGPCGECAGPSEHRHGFGRQLDRCSLRALHVRGVEIFEPHAPRHPVDHQMVHRHEHLVVRGTRDHDKSEQASVGRIERGLHGAGGIE
jgi:hypothetical protein